MGHLRFIRTGVSRTVILIGSWAVKVPSLRGGMLGPRSWLTSLANGVLANQSEREWSGTPGFCPVRWSFLGLVNVYPRCAPVAHGAVVDYDAIAEYKPGDCKPDNVGVLGGRIVWVDYDMSR